MLSLLSQGGSTLMTCAPQSAKKRAATGPPRCCVRSSSKRSVKGDVATVTSQRIRGEASPLNRKHERIRYDPGIHDAEPLFEFQLVSLANHDIVTTSAGDQLTRLVTDSLEKSERRPCLDAASVETVMGKQAHAADDAALNPAAVHHRFLECQRAVAQHRLALAKDKAKVHAALHILSRRDPIEGHILSEEARPTLHLAVIEGLGVHRVQQADIGCEITVLRLRFHGFALLFQRLEPKRRTERRLDPQPFAQIKDPSPCGNNHRRREWPTPTSGDPRLPIPFPLRSPNWQMARRQPRLAHRRAPRCRRS